ncbi:lasso peptide biosynthesis PqqD family chaperone [Streptomyces sp. TRM 70361]|uniref:lasso peptide biosynthesis PqqD family chaperone n=1 Tax=Streptomyces sp. TRM 70361 TaxID=3116553 RepID=UPI002E7C305B|nr:lasso peptide biosynthesis PqqD family chaperone [Streptomyces sp. TRM 70361]MEE1943205.1 lasso peptide biosynthesis PqqD family chaperone [Streptomyces sp. TRM 70361]
MALTLRSGVLMTDTEYGTALLDERSGEYWTLNPTAAAVLRVLLEGRSAGQAVTALTGEYDVSPREAEQDVARILAELREARLVSDPGPDAGR